MELTTQIFGIIAALISLITAILAIIFRNKNNDETENFQETNVIAKNNSNVISNSPNSTITQTTINNHKTSVSNNTSDDTGVIGFMVILIAGATTVAALYIQHEKTIYFILIIECLILALLSIFGTLKHNIGIHETILSMLAIFEGIFIPFVFKHLFWIKFVGTEFIKKNNFKNFAELMTYLFENKAYLFYNLCEFFSVALSIAVITYLIFAIGKILFTKQRKKIKIYDYILALLPTFLFLIVGILLRINPFIFSSIK